MTNQLTATQIDNDPRDIDAGTGLPIAIVLVMAAFLTFGAVAADAGAQDTAAASQIKVASVR